MPDLTRVPKFESLETWIARLQSWCEAAVNRIESNDEEAKEKKQEYEEMVENVNGEMAAMVADFRAFFELEDIARDVFRRVRDSSELKDFLEHMPDMSEHRKKYDA